MWNTTLKVRFRKSGDLFRCNSQKFQTEILENALHKNCLRLVAN